MNDLEQAKATHNRRPPIESASQESERRPRSTEGANSHERSGKPLLVKYCIF